MKIVSPLVLGFADMTAVNYALEPLQFKAKGPSNFLTKKSPEFDFLKALAGYRSLTVIAALPTQYENLNPEAEVKYYLPRSLAGLFDGFSVVGIHEGVVVAELFRKETVAQ